MSKLWNSIIEGLRFNNAALNDEIVVMELIAHDQEHYQLLDEWRNGNRSPLTHSIENWQQLGKPSPEDVFKG